MKYPRYWSTSGRFPLEKTQKTAKQKSTPDQFLGGLSRVNPNLTQPKNRSGVDFHLAVFCVFSSGNLLTYQKQTTFPWGFFVPDSVALEWVPLGPNRNELTLEYPKRSWSLSNKQWRPSGLLCWSNPRELLRVCLYSISLLPRPSP